MIHECARDGCRKLLGETNTFCLNDWKELPRRTRSARMRHERRCTDCATGTPCKAYRKMHTRAVSILGTRP